MRIRHAFIPIAQAHPGMVLGEAVGIVDRGYLCMTLPSGHILTDENLSQLSTCHAEFICIDEADTRNDEQVALDAAESAHRVLDIFEGADLGDVNMAAFFDQVLAYRSRR